MANLSRVRFARRPIGGIVHTHGIESDYESNTGHVIVRTFDKLDPLTMRAVLVAGHAPFTWGKTPAEAAQIAAILEQVASLGLQTLTINLAATPVDQCLLNKHFHRKHGAGAYTASVETCDIVRKACPVGLWRSWERASMAWKRS